ncbi:family 78 glycoside hydrolase catalytic domain [Listeria costaricensis]|uniref:family 78 glycoside hydrolase catalytic domain n=1 Tax=Listeria costaricensis TaxID=2026604 RepID=UPI000C080547|nr:family 78 glycoside hydrolase catalytic domain [Listeria costaricensis]
MVTENQNWQFKGCWIRNEKRDYGEHDALYYQDYPNPVIKKEFELSRIEDLTLYIGALGYYILYINGKRIGDAELNCDWTTFSSMVYYDAYSIHDYLKVGKNQLIIELGNGMYNPAPLKLFGKYNLRETLSEIGEPSVIVDIANKECVLLSSDDTWLVGEGTLLFNNLYLGEKRDFTRSPQNFHPVCIDSRKRHLVPSCIPKIKRIADVKPTAIYETEAGIIVDFGEILSGFLTLEVMADEKQKVVIHYSESKRDDQLHYDSSLAGSVGLEIHDVVIDGGPGSPKKAIQTDFFICKSGKNTFTNTFTYHSFRYAVITGIKKNAIRKLHATYVHTDLSITGSVQVDHSYLQALFQMASRTKLNNVHAVFEDCARERLGYGGDIVALATSNLNLFDLERFYKKTIIDFRLTQTEAGGIAETAPYMGIQSNGTADQEGPLLWQFVYPYLTYKHYQYYGDRQLVETEYPYLKKQMDYLLSIELDTLVHCCIGDHGSVLISGQFKKPTPDKLFVGYCTVLLFLQYHLLLTDIVCQDTSPYQAKYEELKEQVIRRFKNEDGSFGDGTQTSYAFAVALALEDPAHLSASLAHKIREDGLFTTGIFGSMLSYEYLAKYHHDDVIENWLLKEDGICFKQMVDSGNGVFGELFVGEQASLNHAMFTSFQQWYYQGLAGIKICDNASGYDEVLFDPYFSKKIPACNCAIQTKHGLIQSHWKKEGSYIVWHLQIPAEIQYKISLRYKEVKRIKTNTSLTIYAAYED